MSEYEIRPAFFGYKPAPGPRFKTVRWAEPGEGPRNPDAKDRARKVLNDPTKRRPKGSKDDMETVDGDIPEPKEDTE